jgi:hypothetical protein
MAREQQKGSGKSAAKLRRVPNSNEANMWRRMDRDLESAWREYEKVKDEASKVASLKA